MSKTKKEQQQIRAALEGLPTGRARRIPPEVRALIERYVRRRISEGARRNAVARELGVGESTVARAWDAGTEQLRPVRVVPASPAAVTVRGPCGLTIEGLDIDGVAALIRALS